MRDYVQIITTVNGVKFSARECYEDHEPMTADDIRYFDIGDDTTLEILCARLNQQIKEHFRKEV